MKICLVMIVKDESHVIRRALDSVVDVVDYALICDTGSTEDEQAKMLDHISLVFDDASDVEWQFHKEPWRDFAYNRTIAMRRAEQQFPDITHLLMLDADDYVLDFTPFVAGDADAYYVNVRGSTIAYVRLQLFKAHIGWFYEGVVHEYPELSSEYKTAKTDITIVSTREGARNNNPDKYMIDAVLLYDALNSGNCKPELIPRYQFYLAQSYHDAGDIKRAVRWYNERADNEAGYTEERYMALYRLAQIEYYGNGGINTIEAVCRQAQEICPYRREAARFAMKALNGAGHHKRALSIWRAYPNFGSTPDGLFVEPAVYEWQMYEEAGIAAYYCGEYRLSLGMFMNALKGLPNKTLDVQRLTTNMAFAVDEL